MIAVAIGIFILAGILLGVYFDLRAKKIKGKECKQVEKQPRTVRIGDCKVDLESGTCITRNCKVGLSEPCDEYLKPYSLSGSLAPYWASEWHSKYHKALEQRRLGKKEYRKQYTIPYLGGKVGIATLVCWGITGILGLARWISIPIPSTLFAIIALSACILTVIALFRNKY